MSRNSNVADVTSSGRPLIAKIVEPGVRLAQTGEVMPIRSSDDASVTTSGEEFAPSIRYVVTNGAAYVSGPSSTKKRSEAKVEAATPRLSTTHASKSTYGVLAGKLKRKYRARKGVNTASRLRGGATLKNSN